MFRNETNYVLTNGVLLDGTEKMTPQTGRDIYICLLYTSPEPTRR